MIAETTPHVVIIGGGFGGLHTARNLRKAPVRVTLLDRRNFHLFQPLLYQVATGALSPANIAAPLRAILKRQKNTDVWLAEVVDIDLANHRVLLKDGSLSYDFLVVAAGARHHYFGNKHWEKLAPGLKTIEDATHIRRQIFMAFEEAERATDPDQRRAWLTFVIVGGGPTGVELAGAVGELARHTLRGNFHRFDPSEAEIFLVEGADRILPTYASSLSMKATRALGRLGVTVRTGTTVTDIQAQSVTFRTGTQTETHASRTVLWAAGVDASALGKALARGSTVQLDKAGRVLVEPELTLPGHPEVFVIGDMACVKTEEGKPLPGIAPVAMQQGQFVARAIGFRMRAQTVPPFVYRDRGSMAVIGRAAAVVDLGWMRFGGFPAWLTWLFIHLMYLVAFGNRLLVLMQWAGSYITRNRSARLITGGAEDPSGAA
jgi:NADH dehydrogenase